MHIVTGKVSHCERRRDLVCRNDGGRDRADGRDPASTSSGHRRPLGQRRDSPPLLQSMHRRAYGSASSLALGMSRPQFSQIP